MSAGSPARRCARASPPARASPGDGHTHTSSALSCLRSPCAAPNSTPAGGLPMPRQSMERGWGPSPPAARALCPSRCSPSPPSGAAGASSACPPGSPRMPSPPHTPQRPPDSLDSAHRGNRPLRTCTVGAPRARCCVASPPPTAVCSQRCSPWGQCTSPGGPHTRRSTPPPAGTTACPRAPSPAGRPTRQTPPLDHSPPCPACHKTAVRLRRSPGLF